MTFLIKKFRLFCCIANSLEDSCLSRIGAANDQDTKTRREHSNFHCSSPLSFYILCSLEFGIGKRHLSLGCLRWWQWWRIKVSAPGWVYCLVTCQPKEWRHSLPTSSWLSFTLLSFSPSYNFIFLDSNGISNMYTFQKPPTEQWEVSSPNSSTTNLKARSFKAGPTSSSTQTINQMARERMGEYKPLTFHEALLLVIRAPSNGGVSSPLKLKND